MFAFTLGCRFSSSLAEVYSQHVYPLWADCFSFISSRIPFALQDLTVALLVGSLFLMLGLAFLGKMKVRTCLACVSVLFLWCYVWFYVGWCANYSRSSIYSRTSAQPVEFQKQAFLQFLDRYTVCLNQAWTTVGEVNKDSLEAEVKRFYAGVPDVYLLASPRSWHRPKQMMFNTLYSAVGIQGFMGPMYAESFVNRDLLPHEYPFVYAHEYSHMLGVSNEAEANWWAFYACRSSRDSAVRYCAYYGILKYVWVNARCVLSEQELAEWKGRIRPEVMADFSRSQQHWNELRWPWLDSIQSEIYDFFLKSNNVSSGTKNYSEVVQLLISLEAPVQE